ncbi:mitochondrial fission 1 protein A-like, partial [Camellia sinensis]|uniref:mitochondrial fission 1 protein A-like n=1 Tax=Camellia sinensis TaxID=4442 RepID=UPI0010357084
KRCRNPQHFAIINILFHDNKDITPKASNAAVAVALSLYMKFSLGCEREVSEAANGVSDELKSERIIRLSWALVHSKQPEDMQHGIAMLEASLANSGSPLQKREKLYLLAVGYYRSGEYRRSRQLAEQCLEIAPDWMQALTLKKTLDDQITKDGLIGIGITATVVGLVAGGIAASLG